MKKINCLAIFLLLVLSFSISNATEDTTMTTTTSVEVTSDSSMDDENKIEMMNIKMPIRLTNTGSMDKIIMPIKAIDYRKTNTGSMDEFKMYKDSIKRDIKDIREEKKDILKNNFKLIKENRTEIKSEFSLRSVLKGLNSELNDEVKALDDAFRADVKVLEEELKANVGDYVKFKEIRLKIHNLRVAYNEKLIALVSDTEIKNTLTERLELMKKNFELINSNIDARIEFRGELEDKVTSYKGKLSTKLEKGLPKVNEANIEKVLGKMDGIISSIENNTKITQANKDKILSQIIALKELLEEQLESNTSTQLDISAE